MTDIKTTVPHSSLDGKLASHLQSKGINFDYQVRLGDTRVDFAAHGPNGEFKLYVEVDGKQHYEFCPAYHATEADFHLQQEKDKAKDSYMLESGLDFVRIRYDEDIPLAFDRAYGTCLALYAK